MQIIAFKPMTANQVEPRHRFPWEVVGVNGVTTESTNTPPASPQSSRLVFAPEWDTGHVNSDGVQRASCRSAAARAWGVGSSPKTLGLRVGMGGGGEGEGWAPMCSEEALPAYFACVLSPSGFVPHWMVAWCISLLRQGRLHDRPSFFTVCRPDIQDHGTVRGGFW